MRIGIINTIKGEQDKLLAALSGLKLETVEGHPFYCGEYLGCELVVVENMGNRIHTTILTTLLIHVFGVECVISSDYCHGKTSVIVGERMLRGETEYRCDEELTLLLLTASMDYRETASGIIITEDIGNDQTKESLESRYEHIGYDLDGADICQVCETFNVPFASIRFSKDTETDGSQHYKKILLETVELISAVHPVFRIYFIKKGEENHKWVGESRFNFAEDAENALIEDGYNLNSYKSHYEKKDGDKQTLAYIQRA